MRSIDPLELVLHVLWVPRGIPRIFTPCSAGGREGSPFHTTAEGSNSRAAAVKVSNPCGATPPKLGLALVKLDLGVIHSTLANSLHSTKISNPAPTPTQLSNVRLSFRMDLLLLHDVQIGHESFLIEVDLLIGNVMQNSKS